MSQLWGGGRGRLPVSSTTLSSLKAVIRCYSADRTPALSSLQVGVCNTRQAGGEKEKKNQQSVFVVRQTGE